ncbi:hypothetical protein IWW36_000375 [Coemansia brasiliensis]|uniref:SH3 domain-containing protein n=1 Tax=Coemansia brasiliensis TaxID=2650707 RepID=A0A9W8IDG1_9FUNG|nr:hypothetical protein IWW36_000375 [Coemansia brasiliensis]
MQIAYNPASILQAASQLAAKPKIDSAVTIEQPVVSHPNNIVSNPDISTVHMGLSSAKYSTSLELAVNSRPVNRNPPILFGPAITANKPGNGASMNVNPNVVSSNAPINLPMQPTPARPVALTMPQTSLANHVTFPTTTLTQEGFIVVEVTTTVDSLPNMLGHVPLESSASYMPQPLATKAESPMFALSSSLQSQLLPQSFSIMRTAPSVDFGSSENIGVQTTSAAIISSIKPTETPSPTQHHKSTTKPTLAGIERKSSSNNNHTNTTYRLSDGYVVLIAIAILFVSAVMLYFYMRRRKRNRSRVVVTSGRSILSSSNSGSPSVGVEEEDKYFTAGSRPGARNLPPDSAVSVDYQNKEAKRKQNLFNGMQSPLGKKARSPLVGIGEQKINYYDQPIYGLSSSMGNEIGGRPCLAAAKSDIYDCVSNGKRQNNLYTTTDPFAAESYPTVPNVRAAAKRGAISFDHIKLYPLPSIPARGNISLESHKSRLNEYDEVHSPSHVAGHRMYTSSPPEIDPRNPLLDTNLANPGIQQKANGSDPLGIKIKPRKLTRDVIKRSNNTSQGHGKDDQQTANTKSNANGTNCRMMEIHHHHLPAEDKMLAKQNISKQLAHSASTFNQPPLVSPPDTPHVDKQQNREAPNFISLVDSIESLSESYQFAVRHKPPLGPLHVVEPHTPALPDELRIRRGEELFVIGEFADGWVLAINISRASECGMVPRRCLFFPAAPFMTQKSDMEALTPNAQSPTSSI